MNDDRGVEGSPQVFINESDSTINIFNDAIVHKHSFSKERTKSLSSETDIFDV